MELVALFVSKKLSSRGELRENNALHNLYPCSPYLLADLGAVRHLVPL